MSQSQSNVSSAPTQPNNQIQPSKDPKDVRTRLDALSPNLRKEKKNLELIKTWLEDLNQRYPGHRTDAVPCAWFYSALEEYIGKVQNRSNRWNRRGTVNLSKVKKEYLLLRAQPQSTTFSSRAITMVDHTARTLAVIGEAVPGATPLKGIGNALERIAELAKTARGNRAEATRLRKEAERITQLLTDKLGSAQNIDKEAEKDLRAFEVELNTILVDLEQSQRFNRKRARAFFFAKDQKDELRGLQQRLDDAFKAFLTANMVAIRLGVARPEMLATKPANLEDVGSFST
ncbi:hypothetical protein VNI00_011325 [Paramarasmius palmivorus]|uniref:Uncharacterized protein n=1 Tax=Paramarasmius palmivorus TaxID=297713 RepID=A0AAW0CHY8_9AGAR